MPPTVDVIIATNRVGAHLSATVASVLAQAGADWRLTVVDDGVSDPAFVPATVASVPNARVIRQRNHGVSAARNAGTRATSGDLLVFLDDDDVWRADRLRRQVEALADRPDAVGAYSGGWYLDPDGRDLGDGWRATPGSVAEMRRLVVPLPRITTLMIRRGALQAAGGFDESFPAAEDIDVTLGLLQRGPFVPVDEPLVGYRRHPVNMTRTIPPVRLARLVDRAFDKRIAEAKGAGDRAAVADLRVGRSRARHNVAVELPRRLRAYAGDRRPRLALEDLAWALRTSPRGVVAGVHETVRRRAPGSAVP